MIEIGISRSLTLDCIKIYRSDEKREKAIGAVRGRLVVYVEQLGRAQGTQETQHSQPHSMCSTSII